MALGFVRATPREERPHQALSAHPHVRLCAWCLTFGTVGTPSLSMSWRNVNPAVAAAAAEAIRSGQMTLRAAAVAVCGFGKASLHSRVHLDMGVEPVPRCRESGAARSGAQAL